jgi:hypothetical protein
MKIARVSTHLIALPFEHGGPYRPLAGRLSSPARRSRCPINRP